MSGSPFSLAIEICSDLVKEFFFPPVFEASLMARCLSDLFLSLFFTQTLDAVEYRLRSSPMALSQFRDLLTYARFSFLCISSGVAHPKKHLMVIFCLLPLRSERNPYHKASPPYKEVHNL